MEYVMLNNGLKMPVLGFGVFQISKDDTKKCVLDALKCGYRLIDTAQSYKNEKEVGEAIRESGIDRKEIFVTSKVWIDNYGYEKCKQSVLDSLEIMGLDYLDLMLLHQPFADYYGAYRALEELYAQGKVKAIGVSNFMMDRLSDICLFDRKVIPAVNQLEVNPFNARFKDQMNMNRYGVKMEAWAPFGEGRNNLFTNETLVSVGKKYGKSSAQVVLRWLIQREVIVVCKYVHLSRMMENIDVFNFVLSDEDMQLINSLNTNESLFFDHRDPLMVERFDKMVKDRR